MSTKVFRKSFLFLLIIVALVASLLAGCSSAKTIKIGFIAQITGPDSYIGQTAKLALDDRVEAINAAGGINGYKVELITYDSRSEVPDAVAAANRLINQDKVSAIIGPEWSGAAIPIAEIADTAKTPVIATTATNPLVTVGENDAVHPYMFRVCFIDPYQGYALADFAYKELGSRKAAFITDVSAAYSVGVQNYFEEHFIELGGEVVAKEGYQANDQEFRAQISKVAETDADLLIVPTATYRDIALISKQAVALGLDIQYLGGDGWVSEELLAMAATELEGAYVSSGVSTESPEFRDWNAAYEAKHNVKPTVYAYYALDAFEAALYAAGEALKADPNADTGSEAFRIAVRDALENMDGIPVFTSALTMETDTHNPHNKPIVILQISDGQWKIIKTYEP